ncbi:MAG: ATP-dependent zinc metalloprotease FtsH [Elusimicrobia bacterium]|nr:ATP-dependent zinc metalloprotease FtsH [Elusimicrobiota bacterium]
MSWIRRWTLVAGLGLMLSAHAEALSYRDRVAIDLERKEPAITRELVQLVTANRKHPAVEQRLRLGLLNNLEGDALRTKLPTLFKDDAPTWADVYVRLKTPPPARRNAGHTKELRGIGEKISGLGDQLGRKKSELESNIGRFMDGSAGAGDADRADVRGNGWGSKPPPSQGGNDGRITFDDVVGIDEQKEQLMEIVDMLKNPARYRRAGADIPTGILMAGPPGTGKTFTAQALANEAGVNFMSLEGPAFINKYVGESANKVREFFAAARQKAPTILFIDEIEALAGKRLDGDQGAERETNAAVTQLLVEMDGMSDNLDGSKPLVIIVGATNRIDMLDPAVLRPGRFDRKVIFTLPDVKGREAVLNLYVNKRKKKGVPYAPDLDTKEIARQTAGMSPADLRNIVNLASTLAARENRRDNASPDKIVIKQDHLRHAIELVEFGGERKHAMTEKDKKQTAYHELGHAIVGTFVPGGDPITKITIIPRDTGAGGVTMSQPAEERAYWTKAQFLARIAMAMGGRAAEQLVFGEITTGPSSDLQNASGLAREMVMAYGMSDELGPVSFVQNEQGNFMSRGGKLQAVSEATQQKIDSEVKRILLEQEKVATEIVAKYRGVLDQIVPVLQTKETLEGDEFRALVKQFGGGTPPGGGKGAGSFAAARRMGPSGR